MEQQSTNSSFNPSWMMPYGSPFSPCFPSNSDNNSTDAWKWYMYLCWCNAQKNKQTDDTKSAKETKTGTAYYGELDQPPVLFPGPGNKDTYNELKSVLRTLLKDVTSVNSPIDLNTDIIHKLVSIVKDNPGYDIEVPEPTEFRSNDFITDPAVTAKVLAYVYLYVSAIINDLKTGKDEATINLPTTTLSDATKKTYYMKSSYAPTTNRKYYYQH